MYEQWIDVKERLPEQDQEVLIFWRHPTGCNGIDIDKIIYPKDNNLWANTSKEIITHWMPLPSFPDIKTERIHVETKSLEQRFIPGCNC